MMQRSHNPAINHMAKVLGMAVLATSLNSDTPVRSTYQAARFSQLQDSGIRVLREIPIQVEDTDRVRVMKEVIRNSRDSLLYIALYKADNQKIIRFNDQFYQVGGVMVEGACVMPIRDHNGSVLDEYLFKGINDTDFKVGNLKEDYGYQGTSKMPQGTTIRDLINENKKELVEHCASLVR